MDDFALYSSIEKMAPAMIEERRKIYKGVCVNVDFYSGFVYSMLGIPSNCIHLFLPLRNCGITECAIVGRAGEYG